MEAVCSVLHLGGSLALRHRQQQDLRVSIDERSKGRDTPDLVTLRELLLSHFNVGRAIFNGVRVEVNGHVVGVQITLLLLQLRLLVFCDPLLGKLSLDGLTLHVVVAALTLEDGELAMRQIVGDHTRVQVTRVTLDVESKLDVVLGWVLIDRDPPAWAQVVTAIVNDALVFAEVYESTLHDGMLQVLLASVIEPVASWCNYNEWRAHLSDSLITTHVFSSLL